MYGTCYGACTLHTIKLITAIRIPYNTVSVGIRPLCCYTQDSVRSVRRRVIETAGRPVPAHEALQATLAQHLWRWVTNGPTLGEHQPHLVEASPASQTVNAVLDAHSTKGLSDLHHCATKRDCLATAPSGSVRRLRTAPSAVATLAHSGVVGYAALNAVQLQVDIRACQPHGGVWDTRLGPNTQCLLLDGLWLAIPPGVHKTAYLLAPASKDTKAVHLSGTLSSLPSSALVPISTSSNRNSQNDFYSKTTELAPHKP